MLARHERETGPNARIGVLRDPGPALARAGDRAGALEIGFGVFPLGGAATGRTFDTAFALVDAAMYHAKNQGRACATCVLCLDLALQLEAASLPATLAQAARTGHAVLEVHRPAPTLAPA